MGDTDPMQSAAGWKWYGYGGHFCLNHRCAFHLATRVRGYLVSTVGDLDRNQGGPKEIGIGRTFETMVFPCNGEDENGNPNHDGSEIDTQSYNDSREAELGHYLVCWNYHHRQE